MIPPAALARIEPRSGLPSIVTAFVIVTAPKPPRSSVLMMPATAVLEIAPAKVLQGAVREQGSASSPTPETQVRVPRSRRIAQRPSNSSLRECFKRSSSISHATGLARSAPST